MGVAGDLYVNYRDRRRGVFLSEIGPARSRRTEVRPMFSRRAISDLLRRRDAVYSDFSGVYGRGRQLPQRFPLSRASETRPGSFLHKFPFELSKDRQLAC